MKKILNLDYIRLVIKNRLSFIKKERVGKFSVFYPYRPYFFGLFCEIYMDKNYELEGLVNCKKIIDVGANIGVATIYFAGKYPKADINCFEPNPEAVRFLRKNIKYNKIKAKVYEFALGVENKKEKFFIDAEIKGSSSAGIINLLVRKKRKVGEVEVEVRKLSDFIEEEVDILKIDIEGEETGVIKDLIDSGKIDLIKNILVEFHYDPEFLPQSLAGFLQMLEGVGFRYYLNKNKNINIIKDVPHSYMIVAFR